MKPWVKWVVPAASACLLVIGWASFRSTSAPLGEPATQEGTSARRAWKLDWSTDLEYRYSLEWKATTAAEVEATGSERSTFAASVDLAADCIWRSHGERNGRFVLGLSFQNVRRAGLEALGAPMLGDEQKAKEALSTAQVVVELNRDGGWQVLHFEPSQSATVKEVIRALLSEAQFIVPPDDSVSWNAVERTPLGTAQASYSVDARDATRVRRTRTRYLQLAALGGAEPAVTQELDSAMTLQVEPTGVPKRLEHRERITARRASDGRSVLASQNFIQLQLQQITPAAGAFPDLAKLQAIRPEDIIPSPESERAILEQHAAKLTSEELEKGLRAFAKVGTLPNEGIWFVRASSYLKLHPEECRWLKDLFNSTEMSSGGRKLIAQVLASAGHPQAQQVLREVLSSPAATQDEQSYLGMLQALGRVQKPEPESLAFLAHQIDRAQKKEAGHQQRAAEYALGAAVGAMAQQGEQDATLVSQYNRKLVEALRSGRSPEDRAAGLAALGNTRLEENSAVIQAYATDASASVRQQVAISLRNAHGTDARASLLQLAADRDTSVSATALQVLKDHRLTSVELASLAEKVTSGMTDPTLDSLLVTLLSSQALEGAASSQLLSFLLDRNAGNGLIQARIRSLLASHRQNGPVGQGG